MKIGLVIGIVVVALLLVIGVFAFGLGQDDNDVQNQVNTGVGSGSVGIPDSGNDGTGESMPDSGQETSSGNTEHTIEITSSGFSPNTITINQGDTITWINMDSSSHWPASNNHPTHNLYPGFDANRGLATGETYGFTFDETGNWGYHDHLFPSRTGTIIVN